MATFKKGQSVVVKYADGEFYPAEVLGVLKTGKVKVRFEDKEELAYSAKDVFDKEVFIKKQKEKKEKEKEVPKKSDKKAEKEKISDDVFNIDDIDENIDNDLDAILEENTDNVFEDDEPKKEKGKAGKAKTKVDEEDAVFADLEKDVDDDLFGGDDSTVTGDILDGLSKEELLALVKEKGWHKAYPLKLTKTDDAEEISAKIREAVSEEDLASPATKVEDEDDFLKESEPKEKKKKASVEDGGEALDEELGDNWFSEGDMDDEKYAPLKKGMRRFWVVRGESALITFITQTPLTYKEHRVKLEGEVYQLTCYGTSGARCPLCEQRNKATVKKAFYVIDHTEYFSKVHKKQVKNQIRLFVVGNKQYQLLKAYKDKYYKGEEAGWRGLKVEVKRSKDKLSPNSGDMFFVEGVIKKDIFKGDYDKTFDDLKKELKPIPMETLKPKLPMMENEEWSDTPKDDSDFDTTA